MKRTRALSFRKASECEQGTGKRCRCRCGGKLHGKMRLPAGAPRSEYAKLPLTDPHFVCVDKKHREQGMLPLDELRDVITGEADVAHIPLGSGVVVKVRRIP